MRPELEAVVRDLLARSADTRVITLDAVGEAIGTLAVSTDDVDAVLTALEAQGRTIRGPEGQRGAATLQRVIPAVRALAATLGRKPTLEEIATDTGLDVDDVRHALALGRVMGR